MYQQCNKLLGKCMHSLNIICKTNSAHNPQKMLCIIFQNYVHSSTIHNSDKIFDQTRHWTLDPAPCQYTAMHSRHCALYS